MPRCARMRSTSATSTTSCATAKWSSSTNSPAARCRAAAGPTACTRRSKRRNAWRSSARTRRSPRSPSRTCSACTGKLSGMTGTADTEAYEFQNIYGLEVIVIPTHRPMVRKDHSDLVFLNRAGKYRAVVKRDPGSATRRASRCWSAPPRSKSPNCSSEQLQEAGIAHEVLNAKQHEREAHIVANAGRPGAVTIATNMAGRGTDIVLGGSLEAELTALGEDAPEADKARVRERLAAAPRRGEGRRRPAHRRHRTPRIAPHRQPAARPFRPPGRPGFLALLPVARRQPDAHLRGRLGAARHGAHGPEGRRHHRKPAGDQADRQRAAQGRGPQLRHPQEPARLRRRQQRPAQGHLPAARRTARRRQRAKRTSSASARTWSPTWSRASCRSNSIDEQWDLQGLDAEVEQRIQPRARASPRLVAGAHRNRRRRHRRTKCSSAWRSCSPTRKRRSAPRTCACWKSTSCSTCSTRTGRSTSAAWITCARASTCAATRRSSRSRNTRRKRSSCSARCWRR